jgi:Zn-dependent protease with chaperone function
MTSYRYPTEHLILLGTVFVITILLAITAVPTVCAIPLFALLFIAISYQISKSQYRQIVRAGTPISWEQTPELAKLAQACVQKLKPGQVQLFVLESRQLNAFTFGFSNPKTVVLYSPMLQVMDADELKFVIGHELGHVGLGHAWLNTLLGGMAGVPTTFAGAIVLTLAFRWWNRACEYSADRAGLLACGSLNKAVSALAQLAVGDIRNQAELQQALKLLEAQDHDLENVLGETLSTHPMLIKRIKELRSWAQTSEYRRLAAA